MGLSKGTFQTLNTGYNKVFTLGKLSIGLVVPIERYSTSPIPTMKKYIAVVQLAEQLGFSAVWLRDVPFNVPSFDDVGQPYDPFTYLGFLAAKTNHIALGVASLVLPLRHPAHVAKSAASVDELSNGRLILGIASGDRSQEYPAMNKNYAERGMRFRDSVDYIRGMQASFPALHNSYGQLVGEIDMLPKSVSGRLPMLVTGSSQQSPEWIAQNGDGWMVYPREPDVQKKVVQHWQTRVKNAGRLPQPIMQPLYIDLSDKDDEPPTPIHLGIKTGKRYLLDYLLQLEAVGVNHVALNLRFNELAIHDTLNRLAEHILPAFTV